MRTIAIQAYGGADKLELIDLPVPEPKSNEVLVRIKAAGVNRVDTMYREGFRATNSFPVIMGSDFAGIVEKVGANVSTIQSGDEVYGYVYGGNGTYAEYAAVPVNLLAKKPAKLSFEEAASLPCTGMVAYDALKNTLLLQKGETILITGANGGVGMVGIQVAKSLGAHVVATGAGPVLGFLSQLGADEVIDYTQGDYVAAVLKLYKDGVDTALAAAAPTIETIAGAVRDNGRLTWLSGPEGPRMQRMIAGSFTDGSRGTVFLDALTELVESGVLHTVRVDKTYSLEQAAQAQDDFLAGNVQGKLVITL